MTKPFSIRELLARVHAIFRRTRMMEATTPAGPEPIRINNLEIDVARHRASISGSLLDLSPKEFDLLAFLGKNKGLVLSREQLLEKVWGYDYAGDTRTVDVHVRWLRQKIESDPGRPRRLLTVRGAGYKLEG
jgi:two-component system OmpR family response regulator